MQEQQHKLFKTRKCAKNATKSEEKMVIGYSHGYKVAYRNLSLRENGALQPSYTTSNEGGKEYAGGADFSSREC